MELSLGRDKYDGRGVKLDFSRKWGTNLIAAKPRYGKSILCDSVIAQTAKERNVFIIDYRGEHKRLQYPNFFSDGEKSCIDDLLILEGFKFRLSEFDNVYDWSALGFPSGAYNEILPLIRGEWHHDDPEYFSRVLRDLPVFQQELSRFNATHGFEMLHPVHRETKNSLVRRFDYVKDWFYSAEELEEQDSVDWRKVVMKYPHILVNLNLTDRDVAKAQSYVGKILEILARPLNRYDANYNVINLVKPVIFWEEADFMLPNWVTSDPEPSSLVQGFLYLNKIQRYGVQLWFITQGLGLINYKISAACDNYILGLLADDQVSGKYAELTKRLNFVESRNHREFILIRRGQKYAQEIADAAGRVHVMWREGQYFMPYESSVLI